MERDDAPILEFDPSPTAVIEPTEHIDPTDIPDRAVLCFFQDVIAKAVDEFDGREIDEVRSEIGLVPVYELNVEGSRLALVHPGVEAPLAAGFLEELIARGVTRVIACGGAGVLVPEIALGQVIVPTAAIVATLQRHGIPHVTGRTWTTDALYRETREKAARRVAEGCLTVEMEAAAFFAVARFRGITFGQLLHAGDDLSGDVWNSRGWDGHETGRQQLFRLAAEAVLTL
jgi:uridine phosphorylase